MKKPKLLYLFFITILFTMSSLFASTTDKSTKIKNKIFNFSSEKIDAVMSTEWELSGQYLEKYENNSTLIKNPNLKLYKSNFSTNILSDTAIDPTGDMIEIYLKNNVYINRTDLSNISILKLYTSYAIFYLSKDLVETDRNVTIITSDSITTGNGLSANLESGLISVLSNAERKIRDGDNTRTIKGNQMIYNTKTKKWIVKNQSASKLKDSIIKKVKTTFSLD